MQAENYNEKEGWIGALGKAMIKKSVLMDYMDEDAYMWVLTRLSQTISS